MRGLPLRSIASVDHRLAHEPDRFWMCCIQEQHRGRCTRIELLFCHFVPQIAHIHRYIPKVDLYRARGQAWGADSAMVSDIVKLVPMFDRYAAPSLFF